MLCPKCGGPTYVQGTEALRGVVFRYRLCRTSGCLADLRTIETPDRPRRHGDMARYEPAGKFAFARATGGYFATRDAEAQGVTRVQLTRACQHGAVLRVGFGLYRLVSCTRSPFERMVLAWLWSERQGVLSHESALVLERLMKKSKSVHLTLPASWRRRRLKVPKGVRTYFGDVSQAEVVKHTSGVRTTTFARVLVDVATRPKTNPSYVRELYWKIVATPAGADQREDLLRALERVAFEPAELEEHAQLREKPALGDLLRRERERLRERPKRS